MEMVGMFFGCLAVVSFAVFFIATILSATHVRF